MVLLRTEKMTEKYYEHQKSRLEAGVCPMCEKVPLYKFDKWKIIENDFPYDLISSEHHMLVPVRHIEERDLNNEETQELLDIKDKFIHNRYDFIIEATAKNKSIPNHFHLHLIVSI